MSLIKCLLAFSVVVATVQSATYTTVLQNGTNGYTGCIDTHVDKARGGAFNTSTTLSTSWN